MSTPLPAREARFVLSAPPPVRALAIAAGLVVVGVGLLVLTSAYGWPVGVLVLAVVLAVLGVALGLTALLLTRRIRSTVLTTAERISVEHQGTTRTLPWSEVGGVRVVGHRLVLDAREGEGSVSVLNPRRRANPTFLALMTEVQQRLDADRGYSPFS
ncbi:YqeB family protein [Microlunatus flavus]|uniref:YqeB PH domain-containing protein n=1 Tax=Microlunatus flavus TaxID=1036181 RepID=A0A1H9ABD9_9ACTN|nr:hypothetical protein [Microlunatus flavus]SEP73925.1 hypothetical protein SAMN05421756_101544 [Microlunatus flavus]